MSAKKRKSRTRPPSPPSTRSAEQSGPSSRNANGDNRRADAPRSSRADKRRRDDWVDEAPMSALNWALALLGLVCLCGGFYLLSQANYRGDNLAATISPFIIIGSYLLIFVAIVLRVNGKRS